MSGKERLPEERWRRVRTTVTLRGRRSEEMTQSNISSPRGLEVSFESRRGNVAFGRTPDFVPKVNFFIFFYNFFLL